MTSRELRERLKAERRCIVCGCIDDYTRQGKSRCQYCAEKNLEYQKRWLENPENRKKNRSANKRWRDKCKADGRCVLCGKLLPDQNRQMCPECVERRKQRYYVEKKAQPKPKITDRDDFKAAMEHCINTGCSWREGAEMCGIKEQTFYNAVCRAGRVHEKAPATFYHPGGSHRKTVEELDDAGNVINSWQSIRKAATAMGMTKQCIRYRCSNKIKNIRYGGQNESNA